MVAEGGVAAAGGDELSDEGVDRRGEDDGLAAEPEAYLGVAGLDVVEGELADRGCGLRVEQDEQAGDAVFGLDGVVVQQSAGVLPAGLGVDDAGWAVPPDGGELQRGQLVLVGPPVK